MRKQSCGKIPQALVYTIHFLQILKLGKQLGNLCKHPYIYMFSPSDLIAVTYSKKSSSTRKSHMDHKVYYCIIYNSKILETA